jgi:hypothetical protein
LQSAGNQGVQVQIDHHWQFVRILVAQGFLHFLDGAPNDSGSRIRVKNSDQSWLSGGLEISAAMTAGLGIVNL